MADSQRKKRCVIWADQLKGRRTREVERKEKFMQPDGDVAGMKRKGVLNVVNEKTSIGWIW